MKTSGQEFAEKVKKDTQQLKEIEEEYSHLRKLGIKPEKQAELNGIMYGFKLGQKEALEDVEKIIDEYKLMIFSSIDNPKEGTPIVTWNYSIAFIGNILEEIKKRLSEL